MYFSGIDKFSLVDFDEKISCTLFLHDCNFRCPFCHNSALVTKEAGIKIPEEDILTYLKSRRGVIDAVVITGGEPTLHKELPEFIRNVKEMGYLVKLDTNGTNPDMLIDLVNSNLLDYVAVDIKNSKEKYPLTIGLKAFDLSKVIKTVDFLLENHVDYEFRTTLIEEFHTKEEMVQIGKWIKGAKHYRLQRFIDNENCIKHGLHEVKKEDALSFKDILLKYINDVELRSY